MKRPAVWAACWWAAGCAAAAWGVALQGFWLWGSVGAALIAGIGAQRGRRGRGPVAVPLPYPVCSWGWITAAILLFAGGNGLYVWTDAANVSDAAPPALLAEAVANGEYPVKISGMIGTLPEMDGDRVTFRLDSDHWSWGEGGEEDADEWVAVTVRLQEQEELEMASRWKRGDRIRLEGIVRTPEPASNYGGFDYREYLHRLKIHWTFTVKGLGSVETASANPDPWERLLQWNDRIRLAAGNRISRLFPAEEAGYMKGLLIGTREELDPERFREFSGLGLTHILAISGLHITVFAWAAAGLLRLAGATRETAGRALLLTIPLYVLFTGASPSVIRAGLTAMAAVWSGGRGWNKDALSFLGAAALAMLIWNPYSVRDVGFQLSFLVTAGLIAAVPRVTELLPAGPQLVRSSFAVAWTSQIVSFPLTVFYFNQFSLLSLPANLILVPVISFAVTPLGYGALLAGSLWTPVGQVLAKPVSWMNRSTFAIIGRLDGWEWGKLIWPSPQVWWIGMFYLSAAAALYCAWRRMHWSKLEKRGICLAIDGPRLVRRYGIAAGACLMLWTGLLIYGYAPDWMSGSGEGTVAFLDVGQGDSALIRSPDGRTILIDGGGTVTFRKLGEEWKERQDPFEVGRKTVVPLLKKRGVHQLDYIVVSHEDTDHIGGLAAVLEEIPVGALLFNGTLKSSPSASALFRLALEHGVRLLPVHEGDTLSIDRRTQLSILSPPKPDGAPGIIWEEEQNDVTVVALLRMNGVRFLFAGDIGSDEESSLLERLRTAGPSSAVAAFSPADVLKVGHHGSKNSSSEEWLAYWRPALAVISAGRKNVYGHPHASALERLTAAGASILRTDLHGEIQVAADRDGRIRIRTKRTSVLAGNAAGLPVPSTGSTHTATVP
ncbi:DNA internalization-related competence protein ComEC/Rec2 [Gorillibacterium sp. sgz5001074]|uniref:DNA internalization-related competence protein ComEC/Rec2 n=1 Tax=Gorillibacterium sp. sgz5001074 TaxID=3446695 RepID=UPI003F66A5BC